MIVQEIISGYYISVYLPPNYDKNSKYKVIYFTDGQNLFNEGWKLEIELNRLIVNQQIEPILVVGIHSDSNRNSDLIPFSDTWINENWGNYKPKTIEFSNSIRRKIIPYIENKYAVAKGANNRAIAGASLGGLFAMWEGTTNTNYWSTIIAISPSFWVNDFKIFKTLTSAKNVKSKIWFDIGATSGEWNYYIPIIGILEKKNLEYGKDFFYHEDPYGRHNLNSWSKRIKYPLILFAGSKYINPKNMEIAIEVIKSSTSNKYFQRINPIIHLENGMLFSASNRAKYKLQNINDGSISDDGSFNFNGKNDLIVLIAYKNLLKKITIRYDSIENKKRLK